MLEKAETAPPVLKAKVVTLWASFNKILWKNILFQANLISSLLHVADVIAADRMDGVWCASI